jgi:hypothetical protein
MNWRKVRDSDRVRDGRSDAEMAEDRDEERLAREREREAARGKGRFGRGRAPGDSTRFSRSSTKKVKRLAKAASQPRPPKPAVKNGPKKIPPPPKPKKIPPPPKVKAPAASVIRIADQIGVAVEDVVSARRNETIASTGLGGLEKKERAERTAARLGITAKEVGMFRAAMNGRSDPGETGRIASVVSTVAAVTGLTVQRVETSSKRPSTKKKAVTKSAKGKRSTATVSAKSKSGKGSNKKPDGKEANVFVTMWGNVVHLHHDCHSTRGFRKEREPDPLIYRVSVRDPSCRGRRVCGTCRQTGGSKGGEVDRQLRRLHGAAFDEKAWAKNGWSRPTPRGEAINRKSGR